MLCWVRAHWQNPHPVLSICTWSETQRVVYKLYTWIPPHTRAQMPHLAAVLPVSVKPPVMPPFGWHWWLDAVNTQTEIYAAFIKVKGLHQVWIACWFILIFMPFFTVFLKKNTHTLYWSAIHTHKSAQVMSIKYDELQMNTPVWHSCVKTLLGSPVAKNLCSECREPSLIPGQGTKFHTPQLKLHATTNLVQPRK